MQEDYLHYLWKHKKMGVLNLKTVNGLDIEVISAGVHNTDSAGPDFFNAQLRIDDQLWAGNVEIHIKSSDWYLHNHETDPNYDNVILHVVWEHDVDVFRKDNTRIPTLLIKEYVSSSAVENYKQFFNRKKNWINCENDLGSVDDFLLSHWLERLYFERLEQKTIAINQLLDASKNDWEAVLFKMLSKNFGLKVNGDAFLSIANSVNFNVIRKISKHKKSLEALLFGQAGLLEANLEDVYFKGLRNEYLYNKKKFNLWPL